MLSREDTIYLIKKGMSDADIKRINFEMDAKESNDQYEKDYLLEESDRLGGEYRAYKKVLSMMGETDV